MMPVHSISSRIQHRSAATAATTIAKLPPLPPRCHYHCQAAATATKLPLPPPPSCRRYRIAANLPLLPSLPLCCCTATTAAATTTRCHHCRNADAAAGF
jgi:hypothetical protein